VSLWLCFEFISRLLPEELLEAFRGPIRDVGRQLAMEHELLAAHGQVDQLARREFLPRGRRGAGVATER
jgi:hypothetical protein